MKWLLMIYFPSALVLLMSLVTFFFPPKNINYFYGYRTNLSMKNSDTWFVSNNLMAKFLLQLSIGFFLIISIIIIILGKEGVRDILNGPQNFFLAEMVSSSFVVLISIFLTEKKLRSIFDKEGVRK